jgi:hypothetical protein
MKTFWGLLVAIFVMQGVHAQSRKHQYRKDRYFFGINIGTGFTQPVVDERFSLLEPTPQSAKEDYDKQYGNLFQNGGGVYGLHASFAFTPQFSVITQPCFQTQRYSYMNSYHWSDTIMGGEVYKEFLHRQKISSVRIPVLLRFDFSRLRFSPFLQTGISADIAYFASKQVFSDNYIDKDVDRKTATSSSVAEFTPHLNRFNVAVLGGGGISYYREHLAFSLSGTLSYNLRTSINEFNRYADYTGMATEYLDVQDKFNLLSLNILATVMVPLHKKW